MTSSLSRKVPEPPRGQGAAGHCSEGAEVQQCALVRGDFATLPLTSVGLAYLCPVDAESDVWP